MPRAGTLIATAALAARLVASGDVCDALTSANTVEVWEPLSIEYTTNAVEYWSTGAGQMQSDCIAAPANVDEVVAVMKALGDSTENFAIKSGGHNPNNLFSSVDGGTLISLKQLNEVKLDADAKTVRFGPGNRWDDILTALDGTGYSVVGGRIGNVGTGGYMLGGGLSFQSSEWGWAANNVIEYEIVLANATVAKASASSNPDLFLALKGGGNNFGIVTSFTVNARPVADQIWGGWLQYNADNDISSQVLDAVRDFTQNYPDVKAGIIPTAERAGSDLIDIWIIFLFYNGPEPPDGIFDKFLAIGPNINACKTQTLKEMISGNDWAVLKGSVYTIGTETVPIPKDAKAALDTLEAIHDLWRDASADLVDVPGVVASVEFQPFPAAFATLARSMGGDLYDFDPASDRILVALNYSFLPNASFPDVDAAMNKAFNGWKDIVDKGVAAGTIPDVNRPLFANDAYYSQDFFGRMTPEMQALAKKVRDSVDPNGMFDKRTGGFKIGN